MLTFGLNHMTMARASTVQLLDAAQALGCVGVELRNDLRAPLFDGLNALAIADQTSSRGLRILALAEVYAFNDNTDASRQKVRDLLALAQDVGAEAIVLIPRIFDTPVPAATQRDQLREALEALLPLVQGTGVAALIEPLGFANSSLRLKADALTVLNDLGDPDCFGLIHDTFHHHLSGESDVFADVTRIVHVSGVTDPAVRIADMTDEHRVLVDAKDRLGNIVQIKELQTNGYLGPLSCEAFSPSVQTLENLTQQLSGSNDFITSELAQQAGSEVLMQQP